MIEGNIPMGNAGSGEHNVSTYAGKIPGNLETLYQSLVGVLEPIDDAASKYTKAIGGTKSSMTELRNQAIEYVDSLSLASRYQMDATKLMETQLKIAHSLKRDIGMDNAIADKLGAMTSVMDDSAVADVVTKFDELGVSIPQASDHISKMFNEARDAGISFTEYSDEVRNNLKSVESLQFSNGVRSLETMAKKAVELKFSVEQATRLANNLNTNGIKASVEMGAKLQVLGGDFAAFANPLDMLNESLNGVDKLQDRIVNMFGNLGTINKKTGEVEITPFNQQRIRTAADAMGLDPNQIFSMISTKARRNEISNQLQNVNTAGFTDKELERIKNVGQIRNGQAGVSIDGRFFKLDELAANKTMLENFMRTSSTEEDNISDIATDLRSIKNSLEGFKGQISNVVADFQTAYAGVTQGALNDLGESTMFTEIIGDIKGAFDAYTGGLNGVGDAIANSVGVLIDGASDFADLASKFVKRNGGYIYDIPKFETGGITNPSQSFMNGGLAIGPSHEDGGIAVGNNNRQLAEIEGGEFVVNKEATSEYGDILKAINSSTLNGNSTPRYENGGFIQAASNFVSNATTKIEDVNNTFNSLFETIDNNIGDRIILTNKLNKFSYDNNVTNTTNTSNNTSQATSVVSTTNNQGDMSILTPKKETYSSEKIVTTNIIGQAAQSQFNGKIGVDFNDIKGEIKLTLPDGKKTNIEWNKLLNDKQFVASLKNELDKIKIGTGRLS